MIIIVFGSSESLSYKGTAGKGRIRIGVLFGFEKAHQSIYIHER